MSLFRKKTRNSELQNPDNEGQREGYHTFYKRLGYTLLILIIYHLLTYVTIPGVDPKQLLKVANNQSLMMLSMFSGGSFATFSLLSMGLTAYVTAQIIVQLLQSDVIPKLTEWSKQGETGRHKLSQITRALTLVLGFVQSIGVTAGINAMSSSSFLVDNTLWSYLVVGTLMTTGTFIAMWLGDLITENGLGNGVSVIIGAGIICRWPSLFQQFIKASSHHGISAYWPVVMIIITALLMTTFIVWFNQSEKRLRVQYSRQESMTTRDSYLPLKIIVPGVVPVIFASSLLAIPQTILMFFAKQNTQTWYRVLANFFTLNTTVGILVYGLLIVLFTYIYSTIQIEPDKLADNFEKQEAYLPGIVPGTPTAVYIQHMLNCLALPGAIFLALISIIPMLVSNASSQNLEMGISGSSLLIIVGVVTEMVRQANGLRMKQDYQGFLDKQFNFD